MHQFLQRNLNNSKWNAFKIKEPLSKHARFTFHFYIKILYLSCMTAMHMQTFVKELCPWPLNNTFTRSHKVCVPQRFTLHQYC